MSTMPTTYIQRLRARIREAGNGICVGLDPVLAKIPGAGEPAEKIRRFYGDMLAAMAKRQALPAAVKPNIAFYEAHGTAGVEVLEGLIRDFRSAGILVLLDAKRGDIGSTSQAYADMAFGALGADATTVAPYMGRDSIAPFQQRSRGQGIYVLVRTSNPSARDFQELTVAGAGWSGPLYLHVAAKVADWQDGNLGAVVGATVPRELRELVAFWKERGKEVPMLIPGVAVPGVSGGQGGTLEQVVAAIRDGGGDLGLHLINSSSGINYAYEKYPDLPPAEASARALEELIAVQAAA